MAMKLNMLPPSVNNMSVRVFVRAAGIPVEEENVWGQTQGEEYLSKYPETKRIYLNNGNFYNEGDLFRQPDLAATFARAAGTHRRPDVHAVGGAAAGKARRHHADDGVRLAAECDRSTDRASVAVEEPHP